MFTGIIEQLGKVVEIKKFGGNKSFIISADFANQLKIDQSISHNGVCLTVEHISNGRYQLTAIAETLSKTNLDCWEIGTIVNLEKCMQLNDRLDGHIVQGHVDQTAICLKIEEKKGSKEFTFQSDSSLDLIVEKGSICINGVSLTAFSVKNFEFKVAIIPYTLAHTNFNSLNVNDKVNLEFDIIGKYVQRLNRDRLK